VSLLGFGHGAAILQREPDPVSNRTLCPAVCLLMSRRCDGGRSNGWVARAAVHLDLPGELVMVPSRPNDCSVLSSSRGPALCCTSSSLSSTRCPTRDSTVGTLLESSRLWWLHRSSHRATRRRVPLW
jgi:hypothetical protein